MDGNHSAVAINVPAEKCSSGFKPDRNFLPSDSARKVKRVLSSTARVYRGRQLIGARPKPIKGAAGRHHPEYLLLVRSNPPGNSFADPLLKKLLSRDTNGCVVFYSLRSPCVDTCSTTEGRYSILPALDVLRRHKGPKALVFRQVWKPNFNSVPKKKAKDKPIFWCYKMGETYAMMLIWDGQEEWHNNVLEMNARVPLYRCSKSECLRCLDDREVDGRCVHNDPM